ncbi:hypothetical protein [Hoeflea sp.]|uniref:hypothetical protein n=1 Tax=Hoeflea sp. TaxID=1940281 RepID=UPI003F4AAF5E
MKFATAAFLACGISAGALGDARLTKEQMAAIDHEATALLLFLECDSVARDNDVGNALIDAVGLNDQAGVEGPVNDYYTMRFESEKSVFRRIGKSEYCATGWWRYGANGTVVPGLLLRTE